MIIPTVNKLILSKDFDAAYLALIKNKKNLPYGLFQQKLLEIYLLSNSQMKVNKFINKYAVELIYNLSI